MGWWTVQGTDATVGDGSLDAFGGAVASVIEQYRTAFGRKPTAAEWEALLVAVLGAKEPEARALDEGVVENVRLDVG